VQGALCDGFAPASPYQAILIEGGTQWLPEKIINQLAEKGRIACVYYRTGEVFSHFGTARVYEKMNGVLTPHDLFEVAAPILPSLHARPAFEF
jgi:protein-L-isoaspartate(D-aspartate) O-methyltransferase